MAADREHNDSARRAIAVEPTPAPSSTPEGDFNSPFAADEVDSGSRFQLPDTELMRMFDEACNVDLPNRIGRYRVLSLLGTGGMGMVYRAEQDCPHRLVALKTLRIGLADRRMTARFENEIASLARLRHPSIAQIYDAGVASTSWGRQPYIAMELVDGPRLIDYVQRHGLSINERLGLFARICDAVEHAHQRGVIHRDLKPANILVVEEVPADRRSTDSDAARVFRAAPKILDFGVARLLRADHGRSFATNAGEVLGTLAYMSPEQASGSPDAIDTRSDVYALGCILYELLGDRPPLDLAGLSVASASSRIANDRPPPLHKFNLTLRGDLEIIAAKALEKTPDRRYASAAALAADVRRFLSSQPIAARKPSILYIARKWVSRHRVTCIFGGVAAISLAFGALGVVSGLLRSERARQSRQQMISGFLESVNGIATDVLPRMASIAGTAQTRRDLLARLEPMRDQLRNMRGNDSRLMAIEADVLDAIAQLETDFSDPQARLAARHAVLEARRRLIGASPDDRRQMLRFAIDHVRIGDILHELRDVAGAETWYRRAFDIQNAVNRSEPGDLDVQIALTWSHARLAHTSNRLGRMGDLLTHLRAAESALEDLKSRTTAKDEIRLLDCRQQLLALWADYYMALQQRDAHYRVQRARVECLRRLTELDPSNSTYLVRAAAALVNISGNDVANRLDCDTARRDLADAQPLLERLRRLEPFNAEACEVRVNAQHTAARIEAEEGRPAAALDLMLRARELLLAQIEISPITHCLAQLDNNAGSIVEYSAVCGLQTLGEITRRETDDLLIELGFRAAPPATAAHD